MQRQKIKLKKTAPTLSIPTDFGRFSSLWDCLKIPPFIPDKNTVKSKGMKGNLGSVSCHHYCSLGTRLKGLHPGTVHFQQGYAMSWSSYKYKLPKF